MNVSRSDGNAALGVDNAIGWCTSAVTDILGIGVGGLGTSSRGSIAENGDDLASDNNTVGMSTDSLELFAVRDSESDCQGQIGVTANAGDKVGKLDVDGRGGTGDSKLGNDVDEAVSDLGQVANAGIRRRRGNQRNV
jgi:hypothetical protein